MSDEKIGIKKLEVDVDALVAHIKDFLRWYDGYTRSDSKAEHEFMVFLNGLQKILFGEFIVRCWS